MTRIFAALIAALWLLTLVTGIVFLVRGDGPGLNFCLWALALFGYFGFRQLGRSGRRRPLRRPARFRRRF